MKIMSGIGILNMVAACMLGLNAGTAEAAGTQRRVLIIGDSMMQLPARFLKREFSRLPGFETRDFTSLGSGLARLDAFDWMAEISNLVDDFDPDATIAWFGANDRQPMKVGNVVIRPGTMEWDNEYAKRVGKAMDLLTAREGTLVYWLELPDMRETRLRQDVSAINDIVLAESERRESVVFVPTRPFLSRNPGEYSPYVNGPDGLPVRVRDFDGVHLERPGAELVARHMRKYLTGQTGNDTR